MPALGHKTLESNVANNLFLTIYPAQLKTKGYIQETVNWEISQEL